MSYNYFKNGVLNLIAGKHPTDKALSATSNHPVANRILKAKFDETDTHLSELDDAISEQEERELSIESVNLPFTPPKNGLLLCFLRAGSNTARSYVDLNGSTPGLVDFYTAATAYYTGVEFVSKGVEVSVSTVSNISGQVYYYISF